MERPDERGIVVAERPRWPVSVLLPGVLGAILGGISIQAFDSYGLALFIAMPMVVGYVAGVINCIGRVTRTSSGVLHGLYAAGLSSFLMLFAGIEGLLCIIMVAPLGIGLGAAGGALGCGTTRLMDGRGCMASFPIYVMLALFPALLGVDITQKNPPPIRKVVSSVEIDAPIEEVWEAVISFSRIEEPPTGILATGIAYPIEARLEGEGVGAMRYCTFSTGSFVEPITAWEEPHLLAFDVIDNPPAMRETSFYRNLETPHATGHMVSHKGQFRLYEQSGRVVVEGTTWYSHEIAPQWYWAPMSDHIIHAIHDRVLTHIKQVAEDES